MEPLRDRDRDFGVPLRLREPDFREPLRDLSEFRDALRDFSEPASICKFGEFDRLAFSVALPATFGRSSPLLGLLDRDDLLLLLLLFDVGVFDPDLCCPGEFDLKYINVSIAPNVAFVIFSMGLYLPRMTFSLGVCRILWCWTSTWAALARVTIGPRPYS